MDDGWSEWPAPAKLNLFLHIVGRRADGYHLLQTVFQLLDWSDTVRLRVRSDGRITRGLAVPGVPVESDISLRAAHALQRYAGCRLGVEINIEKTIPIGGGLGGGSSNAATTLVALNELWSAGLPPDELAGIGLELGADVPLFIRGNSAWAEGVGERLTPIDLPGRSYAIIDPRVSVATAPLFQAAELTRNSAPTTIEGFLAGIKTANAFAPLARARYPQVTAALDWLSQYGEACLSGSGGCVFLATGSVAEAEEIVKLCPPEFAAYRAIGLARSPLIDALEHYRGARSPKFRDGVVT